MNKQRRKEIDAIIERLETLKGDIESVYDDEEMYRDGIPESMTEKYEVADNACTALDDAMSAVDDAIEQLTTARNGD